MEKFENLEPSQAETSDEEVFQKYVEDLRLSSEDFEKKILDIGSGSAQFAKWASEHGVSSNIYSIDKSSGSAEVKNKVIGEAELLPFADNYFDLVVSNAAIPHIYLGEGNPEEVKEKVFSSLNEASRVLKPGGEIRLAKVLIGDVYPNQKVIKEGIQNALSTLEKNGFEVVQEHTPLDDTYEYEGHEKKRLLARAYLIVIKKSGLIKNPEYK